MSATSVCLSNPSLPPPLAVCCAPIETARERRSGEDPLSDVRSFVRRATGELRGVPWDLILW